MKRKDARHLMAVAPPPNKSNGKPKSVSDVWFSKERDMSAINRREDAMIEAMDMRKELIKHAEWIDKLRTQKIGVEQFLGAVSPDAAVELLSLALGADSDKVKLDALRDILDRAGYSKVQKLAVGNIDPSAPRQQLISIIEGLSRKGKEIEIVEDDVIDTEADGSEPSED